MQTNNSLNCKLIIQGKNLEAYLFAKLIFKFEKK